jgi:hypothetical protein
MIPERLNNMWIVRRARKPTVTLEVPKPPRPMDRIVFAADIGATEGMCDKCKSSQVWPLGWLGKLLLKPFDVDPLGCINPECDYYARRR